MNFETITGYFYKLYNICYFIVLIPMGLFIFLYVKLNNQSMAPLIGDQNMILIIQIVLAGMGLVDLLVIGYVQRKKIQRIALQASLRVKMEDYAGVAILRIAAGSVACLVMATGFALTSSEWFTVFLVLILVWLTFQWPTPRKMSGDLKLKGDERDVILYKRDLFKGS